MNRVGKISYSERLSEEENEMRKVSIEWEKKGEEK